MSEADLLKQFQQAIGGLTVMSESDYPIEVLRWQCGVPLTAIEVLKLAGKPADSPIEAVEVADFFAPMTQEQDWQSADETIGQRFRDLVKLIQDTLSQAQVYRVGTIAIDVYIVGKPIDDHSDSWIALSTKVIET